METLTGEILVIIGAILLTVAMIGGSMYVFNKGFRTALNDRIDRYSQITPEEQI